MKHVHCPKCGKQLIRLEPIYTDDICEYWCDDCDIDIEITFNQGNGNLKYEGENGNEK